MTRSDLIHDQVNFSLLDNDEEEEERLLFTRRILRRKGSIKQMDINVLDEE